MKLVLGILLVVGIIGVVYYFGTMPQQDSSMPAADDGGSMQAPTQAANSPRQAGGGGASSADINAAVSAMAGSASGEGAQATSENGTESAAQFNSSLDNSVYAE